VTGPLNLKRHPKSAPVARPWEDPRLDEGIHLYNEGHHWHAHESWEPLWMGLEGDEKLFLQGLIMSAAMLHQYHRRVAGGVRNHWANVEIRLPPHRPEKWGIDVEGLLGQLRRYAEDAAAGRWTLDPAQVRIGRKASST
jgi:hypothetical protein